MDNVKKTSFENSDNNSDCGNSDGGAYSEEEVDESEFRDDFSLSDEEESKQDCDYEKDEEERDRDFFGDEDYGTLQSNVMSMTMQQREKKEREDRIKTLKNDIRQIQNKISQRKS